MINIIPAMLKEDIDRCTAIRREVFVVGQQIPEKEEIDDMDMPGSGCMHFLVVIDGKDAGAFRMSVNRNNVAKLQRFCLLEEYRGKGHGKYMLEFVDGYCEAMEIPKVRIDAQCAVAGFYEKGGYEFKSEPFEEVGIMHVKMQKKYIL